MKNNKKEYLSQDILNKDKSYNHMKQQTFFLDFYLYYYNYFNAKRKIKSLIKKNKTISYNKTFFKHFFFMPLLYMILFLAFLIISSGNYPYLIISFDLLLFVVYWAKKKTNNDILTLERIKKWKIDKSEDKDKAIKEFTSRKNIKKSIEHYYYISERIESVGKTKTKINPFIFAISNKKINILLLVNFISFFIIRSIEVGLSDAFSESFLFISIMAFLFLFCRVIIGFALNSTSDNQPEDELNEKYPI